VKHLLDTNVLSEFMRAEPAEAVMAWLEAQASSAIWVCAINRAEIELGMALLPQGKRRQRLEEAADAMFEKDFAGRCLPFDDVAAKWYAQICAKRSMAGRPVSVEDAQIAAIALANGLAVATRNEKDFSGIDGLVVVNPWDVTP
jgi:predicted nucleic acid-binding protein